MKSLTFITMTVLALAYTTVAHMQLVSPAPFGAANNPHRTDPADEFLQYPYNCCGRKTEFPCRGYLKLLGTPQGAPTATWAQGSVQKWSIAGIGNHYGGSCQVGFSVDKGKTFQVATSYEGNCPHRKSGDGPDGQSFNFTVPADLPAGDVVFAWTWFNREQEFNMNCAAVHILDSDSNSSPASTHTPTPSPTSTPTVAAASTYTTDNCHCTCTAPPSKRALLQHKRHNGVPLIHNNEKRASTSTPYAHRPGMLFADLDPAGCLTPHSTAEVKFPHPGPDVVEGDGEYPVQMPGPRVMCGY